MSEDPVAAGVGAMGDALVVLHRGHALSELRMPTEDGVFPSAVLVEPLPVVVDANWLRADVLYACRSGRRTTLLTAANEQFIRVFCAEHVVAEVVEHAVEWAEATRDDVDGDLFLGRFRDDYLPVIRVVPDDAIPVAWMSPAERARLAQLTRRTDREDLPSVRLALAQQAPYVSKDKRPLRAVYGDESDWAMQAEWLSLLKAGGDVGELKRLLSSAGMAGGLAGYGVVGLARWTYAALGPVSIGLGIGGAYGLWRWLRHPSRQGLRSGLVRALEFMGNLALVHQQQQRVFEAALPPFPTWEDGDGAPGNDAVLGRALLRALSRNGTGHRSARELSEMIRRTMPYSDARVRGMLRSTACFAEVYWGRWQVGIAVGRYLPAPDASL